MKYIYQRHYGDNSTALLPMMMYMSCSSIPYYFRQSVNIAIVVFSNIWWQFVLILKSLKFNI